MVDSTFRVMTANEFRQLVNAMDRPVIAAMVAIMGETGIRKGEALHLKWENLDPHSRLLSLDQTKSGKVRHVPLSDYALDWTQTLTRYFNSPYFFVNSRGKRWINPEKAFQRGRTDADLEWVGFHDLRRFRATQWVKHGVDIRTVKELLGHADIKTTMRYAHFSPNHATRSILDVQRTEEKEILDRAKNGHKEESKEKGFAVSH